MVFHKVLQKVDLSYKSEINQLQTTRGNLQTEEERLVKQREQDLLRLQRERWSRFSASSPSPSIASSVRSVKGSTVGDPDEVDNDSETNSVNEVGSAASDPWEHRSSTVSNDGESQIGIDDLPSQPLDIPATNGNGAVKTHSHSSHSQTHSHSHPHTHPHNHHSSFPCKPEWHSKFIAEQGLDSFGTCVFAGNDEISPDQFSAESFLPNPEAPQTTKDADQNSNSSGQEIQKNLAQNSDQNSDQNVVATSKSQPPEPTQTNVPANEPARTTNQESAQTTNQESAQTTNQEPVQSTSSANIAEASPVDEAGKPSDQGKSD